MGDLKKCIRDIPDFPKKGIIFKDVTTLFKNSEAFQNALQLFYEHYRNEQIDKVAGIESRGFILGSALAAKLGCGFVPIRKKGKLPSKTVCQEYSLEYGKDSIEVHIDSVKPGERVLLHDDLLATGGTMGAAVQLIERLNGTLVGISCIIELEFLNGRSHLGAYPVFSLIRYDNE